MSFRYIAQKARQDGIKVLLSGVGGDELFLGYPGTRLSARIEPFFKMPLTLRNIIPEQLFSFSNKLYKVMHLLRLSDHLAAVVGVAGKCFFENELDGLFVQRKSDAAYQSYFESIFSDSKLSKNSTMEKIMQCDFSCFLPNNCLHISDVSAMREGVEMRVPLLTNQIIDFALQILQ